MSMDRPATLRFGAFVVDRGRRLLLRDGQSIHVSPKALQLLLVLLEQWPAAVSKRELHEAIWPETFVSETALTGLVAELRGALGDDARHPRLIRTLHGFGYAFTGDVTTDQALPVSTRFRLTVLGREVALKTGENLIGRAAEATVFVDDPSVSRAHAKIVVTETNATLHDLGSKNGTFVNGIRVETSQALRHRDVIAVGVVAMTFHDTRTSDSTMTVQME